MSSDGLLLIGGVSASGKSALALRVAEATDGVIVNADSMQLCRDLRILTARPAPEDEARVEHRLYGVLGAAEPAGVGSWLALVEPVLAELRASRRLAIVVGGTGFYLRALLYGLSPIPDVPAALRARLRAEASGMPTEELHRRLGALDPMTAARLRPSDRQRIQRALEVKVATGRSLGDWQAQPRRRIALPQPVRGVALLPPPELLNDRILARLRGMVARGALDEVAALTARRDVPADAPILRATGITEFRRAIEGTADLATAVAAAALATRQYAKRQRTFFRRQLPELQLIRSLADCVDVADVVL